MASPHTVSLQMLLRLCQLIYFLGQSQMRHQHGNIPAMLQWI
ncbi:hypothetical protein E2C01_090938 [Portunus trituberculatus]|uniref:Uncharacterized protein n=1 Tax=Portunus trituberculatus TaxID=210409 RepID=A0A5B7JTR4_PORTR|nr:hypothetical protein [Portunus trituberculatus]